MKTIIYKDRKYFISDDLWDKYIQMHPIRTEEALNGSLSIVFGDKNFSEEDIKNHILDEYDVHISMGDIIEEARDLYVP